MAAALAAARAGAWVLLVEAGPAPGGTVTGALIHTLGGLYDQAGEPLYGGLPLELVRALMAADSAVGPRRLGRTWVLEACPDLYRAVVGPWLDAERRLTLRLQSRVSRLVAAGGRIEEVVVAGRHGEERCHPRAVIDATGSAEVVRLVDPKLVQDDGHRAAGGLIVRLRGVEPGALAWPRGLAVVRALRGAAVAGSLPAECAHAWVDRGVREGEVYLKLFVPLPDGWRDPAVCDEVARRARGQAAAAVRFLRALPGFAAVEVDRVGELGVRDGGRVCGEYLLTAEDVRAGRRFPDPACRCAWPIEFWDPVRGVSLEYLPGNGVYEIPVRSLKIQGVTNLWAAGKCLSADALAQASARVAGTCWAMGEAAGRVAVGAAPCR
jgi:hypothetical protein